MTTIVPGHLAPAALPAPVVRHLPSRLPSVLAAAALAVAVVPALCVNWVYVYVQFFGVAPELNPTTVGLHRGLLLLGLACVAVMAWVGARRGGWSAFSAGVALAAFGLVAAVVRVEGAIPGF